MLRINTLLCILFVLFFRGQAQSFEGKVTYRLEIKNADPNRIPDSVFNMMYQGSAVRTQTYFHKGNSYKSVTDGPVKAIQIYEPSENKVYSYTEGAEVAFWSEPSKEPQIKKLDTLELILGFECRALLMTTNNNETTLWSPSKYKIDTSKFKSDNSWEKYLRVSESVPLKYVIRTGGAPHLIVLTATEISESKLPDDFFRIPKFNQLMKSPF